MLPGHKKQFTNEPPSFSYLSFKTTVWKVEKARWTNVKKFKRIIRIPWGPLFVNLLLCQINLTSFLKLYIIRLNFYTVFLLCKEKISMELKTHRRTNSDWSTCLPYIYCSFINESTLRFKYKNLSNDRAISVNFAYLLRAIEWKYREKHFEKKLTGYWDLELDGHLWGASEPGWPTLR